MILPGATVGVLGGGQLGRMFTLQARTMGYGVVVLDPDPASPAGAVANRHIQAPYDDERALSDLSASCAAITTEFENVPATALQILAQSSLVRPPVEAVATSQDRIAEKSFLQSHGIPTAKFQAVRDLRELKTAVTGLRLPALLKTSRLGYDGKGQALVRSEEDAVRAFQRFGGVPCVLEERLALECELSCLASHRVGNPRRHDRSLQNSVAVPVLGNRKRRDVAVGAAGKDHGELGFQLHPFFQNARDTAETLERADRVLLALYQRLSLAIVSQTAGLEQCRKAEPCHRRL